MGPSQVGGGLFEFYSHKKGFTHTLVKIFEYSRSGKTLSTIVQAIAQNSGIRQLGHNS